MGGKAVGEKGGSVGGMGGRGEEGGRSAMEVFSGGVRAGAWGYGGAVGGTGGMGGAGSIVAEGDEVMKFLREGLARLQASQSKAEREAREAEDRLVAAAEEVLELERAMKGAESKYRFVQDLRQYIAVLCDFLKDKAALIEELEESLQQLQEERANAAFERRRADLADELAQAEAATMMATAVGVAAAAVEAVVEGGGAGGGRVELDEFGRDVNLQKRSGRQEILTAADAVFADAAEEYSRIERVKERMERWKQQHPAAYRDAYASMSAPALFAPLVRLELLRWDPLFGGGAFDSMHWYSVLFDYGLPTDGSEPAPDDPDTNLVPRLVEKVGLPILHHALQHCWDPLDRAATNRAATAVEEVLVYVEAGAPAVVEMVKAVEGRMESAVAEMQLPAWPPPILAACPSAARFAAQRFGQALRLIHNLGRMRDVVSQQLLDRLVLQSLLANQLLPHLRALAPVLHDAVPRTERLVCVLCDGKWAGTGSGSALPPSAEPRNSPRSPLSQLVPFIETLGRSVESRSAVEGQREECVGLARRLKRMLPAWNNGNLKRLANKIISPLIFAHVRAAYPGIPVNDSNCQPFVCGRYMWMHNGGVGGFHKVRRKLLESLRDDVYQQCPSFESDSAICFALFLNQIQDPMQQLAPEELVAKMEATINEVNRLCGEAGVADELSLLNFVVSDGRTVVATKYCNLPHEECATLYYASGSRFEALDGSSNDYLVRHADRRGLLGIVASEPLTDESADWIQCPSPATPQSGAAQHDGGDDAVQGLLFTSCLPPSAHVSGPTQHGGGDDTVQGLLRGCAS
ncbi:unnamed protein product, partial [Closterium sp. Yama58-4]